MNKTLLATILTLILVACAPITPTILPNSTNTTSENTTEEIVMEPPQEETPEEPADDTPTKTVVEGELVNFPNLKAVDPDGDPITYAFTSPLNSSGEWQTIVGDAGQYRVTISASDGVNTVTQDVLIIVKPRNSAPTIELDSPVATKEGQTLVLLPDVKDADGDEVTVTYSGWMTSNTKEVGYNDSGSHRVTITATDGKDTTTLEIIVAVENVNRPPVLETIAPVRITEGEKVTLNPQASDADGDTITFSYSAPFNEQGTWTTERGDAGEYEIIVTASDPYDSVETTFMLTVDPLNRPPVIQLESPILANEGDLVVLNPVITDPEGDQFTVTYSGWMNSNSKQTGYDDAGNHKVTITATDNNGNEAKLEVLVNVADVNRPPTFGEGAFN